MPKYKYTKSIEMQPYDVQATIAVMKKQGWELVEELEYKKLENGKVIVHFERPDDPDVSAVDAR
jgi:hypothetical protein